VGAAAGLPLLEIVGGGAAAATPVVQYLHLDRAPAPASGEPAAEAMFHAGAERAE
jgi:hypothetical protein